MGKVEGDALPEVWSWFLKGEQTTCGKGEMGGRTEVRKDNCARVAVTFNPGSWDHLDL